MDNGAMGAKGLSEAEDRGSQGGVAEDVGGAQVGADPAPDAAAAKVGGSGEISDANQGDGAEGGVQAQEGAGGEVVEVRQRDADGDVVVSDVDWNEANMDPSAGYDHQAAQNGAAPESGPPPAVESDEDADLFVEVEQQELAGSDHSEEFFENAEASATGESVVLEGELIEDVMHAEIGVDDDDAHDEHRERLEEEAMLEAIRQCVTDAVLAEHLKEQPEKGREDLPACDSNPELPMNSSEPEHVKEADQSKEQPEYSNVDTATRDSKLEVPTQSGGEPDVVVEELDDSNSSDDENKTSSAPSQSSSAAAGHANGPSLLARPAGLGSSTSLLQPPARPVQQVRANGPVAVDRNARQDTESAGDDDDENDEIREKLQAIRVKFLRLANRFGQTSHNMVVSQVLYRLGLAEQIRRNGRGVFSYDRAQDMAERLEAASEPLDLSCTILVLGKTGVGKSATINSIFDDVKLDTDAFESSTRKVQEVVGMVEGISTTIKQANIFFPTATQPNVHNVPPTDYSLRIRPTYYDLTIQITTHPTMCASSNLCCRTKTLPEEAFRARVHPIIIVHQNLGR